MSGVGKTPATGAYPSLGLPFYWSNEPKALRKHPSVDPAVEEGLHQRAEVMVLTVLPRLEAKMY